MQKEVQNFNGVYEGSDKSLPDEISMKALFSGFKRAVKYIISRWIQLCIFAIIGGILGFTYAKYQRPIYHASTTFVLEDENKIQGGLGQYAGIASVAGLDLGGSVGSIFQGDNILELYKSRSMIEKALLKTVTVRGKNRLLIDEYIDLKQLRGKWAKNPLLKNLRFDTLQKDWQLRRTQDSILAQVVVDINKNFLFVTKPDKKLSIIYVDVRAEDEIFAQSFDNAIVQTVNDFYIQTKTKKAIQNLTVLQHQADSVRRVLSGAIYATVAVGDATPNINPNKQLLRVPAQKFQFNAEANKAILTQLVQNLETARLTLRQETPLIQVIDKPILPLPVTQLGRMKGILVGVIISVSLFLVGLFIRRCYILLSR